MCAKSFSSVLLSVSPWTAARQAPLSVGFSRQGYWSGLPCPPPGDLPDPGMEPASPMSPALAGGFFTTRTPREVPCLLILSYNPSLPCSLLRIFLESFEDWVSDSCSSRSNGSETKRQEEGSAPLFLALVVAGFFSGGGGSAALATAAL